MFDSIMLKDAVNMFLFLATELSVLYLIIAYLIGVLQEYITPSKIQNILSSKKGKGYIIAGFLGAITPFCSCSTIPFLKGLLKAKAGFGPMLTFLFASPLLNPIIIGLFFVTFGSEVTIFYFTVALGVSILSGYVLEKMGFEKYVKDSAYTSNSHEGSCCSTSKSEIKPITLDAKSSCCSTAKPVEEKLSSLQPLTPLSALTPMGETSNNATESPCGCSTSAPMETIEAPKSSCCSSNKVEEAKPSCCGSSNVKPSANKWLRIWQATWRDFKSVLPYLLIGVTLGSVIYGFMPTEFVTKVANENNPFAIPIAAVIGIPLYIRAEAVIPLSAALAAKGMGLGAVMALIIGSAGASLTEVILLKAIFKNPMIIAFVGVILTMAISAGFMYQWIF